MDPYFSSSIYRLRALRLGHKLMGKNARCNLQYGPLTQLVRDIYIQWQFSQGLKFPSNSAHYLSYRVN